jgi:hypothetical protein
MNVVNGNKMKIPLIITILYQVIFPISAIILLMFVSPTDTGRIIANHDVDFIIRLIVCCCLCVGYYNMPFISKSFWFYTFPEFKKSSVVIYPKSLVLSAFMIIIRFLVVFAATNIIIDNFLPTLMHVKLILDISNGLIFALPALAQYLELRKS